MSSVSGISLFAINDQANKIQQKPVEKKDKPQPPLFQFNAQAKKPEETGLFR